MKKPFYNAMFELNLSKTNANVKKKIPEILIIGRYILAKSILTAMYKKISLRLGSKWIISINYIK